ncbi:MAG TPA: toll/interleukin-1 receptor domain-containing protein [Longimicrobium sp.]|nr:toll/interleukin-1 receptor domain-containing protein [Longimicrobium sp.]
MDIFISWSGDRSRFVASALKTWISDVFLDVRPWMSAHDIEAGARWGAELEAKLEASNFGILCLTPENLDAAWLLYEAGSLAKAVSKARVVPYLVELKATDVAGPLAQFQGVAADTEGTFKLLQAVDALREQPLEGERLRRQFEKWWPDLEAQLGSIPPPPPGTPVQRSDRALLEEILEGIRRLQRPSNKPVPVLTPAPGAMRLSWLLPELTDEGLREFARELRQEYLDSPAGDAPQTIVAYDNLLAALNEMVRRGLAPTPNEAERTIREVRGGSSPEI